MKLYFKIIPLLFFVVLNSRCTDNPMTTQPQQPQTPTNSFKYLALGDSYTIGQSVCETCRFPSQLKDSIQTAIPNSAVDLKIIATTGWTTTDLKNAISSETLANEYDLVTLLIGVNNQYQQKPFALYESEFPQLVNTAIALAKGDRNNVIVVSIPDYAYTSYGGGNQNISSQIQQYNNFALNYCNQNSIVFVNITDITQQGLEDTSLVASDGLHPSKVAYTKFVERILPKAITALQN